MWFLNATQKVYPEVKSVVLTKPRKWGSKFDSCSDIKIRTEKCPLKWARGGINGLLKRCFSVVLRQMPDSEDLGIKKVLGKTKGKGIVYSK